MPFFQITFFKFKPDADPAVIQEWLAISKTMPEKIPCEYLDACRVHPNSKIALTVVTGVRSLVAGRPAPSFEHRAKGWDLAACVELDSAESLTEFHEHPEHIR
jgi:hypothetical protein